MTIYQEAQDGTMDALLDEEEIDNKPRYSKGWTDRWVAWIWQIVATLSFLQESVYFTHNDLHTNNITWRKTDQQYLYYKTKDKMWKVPTYGKIFSIIDFGRCIFKIDDQLFISDDLWPNNDAGGQYNFGPFYCPELPKNAPNMSFDLSRLAISLIDGLYQDEFPKKKKGKNIKILSQEGSWKIYETESELFNMLWSWTVDDAGRTVYSDEDGEDKYDGFELYIRIAHDVHNAVPKNQLNKSIFSKFIYKQQNNTMKNVKTYNIGV